MFTFAQKHHSDREPVGVVGDVRRGLAQLSSHVPVGLQGGRAGQLPAELDHGVHRRMRLPRVGVRSEDVRSHSGVQAVQENGRRASLAVIDVQRDNFQFS